MRVHVRMIPYAAVPHRTSAPNPAPIFAIVGPTASGKTDLALGVAERIGAEIVSCDSMQLYRELDIGTAKPTAAERARVPHHLVDVLPPDASYSAARYAEDADRAIGDITARQKRVLVVGGTGLYLRALRFGLFAAPPRDDRLRQQLLDEEARTSGILHLKLAPSIRRRPSASRPPISCDWCARSRCIR